MTPTTALRASGPRLPLLAAVLLGLPIAAQADDGGRIRPSDDHPSFWQYGGRALVLLGGSDDDNLFQWEEPRLRAQLDRLAEAGGNYVRNTMSSRDEGNLWPFERGDDGLYDLDRPNEAYWHRFETLLRLARERGIVVQVELWDRFDFAREPWLDNPYNPANNRNYSSEESGLRPRYPNHPGSNENRFFFSVPALDDNRTLLRYQRAQVDRMLEIALGYPNVLYCMDNETSGRPEWGAYWADYLRDRAEQAGVSVQTTEMWDPWDLSHPSHRHTVDDPARYTFVEVSQNNHQVGQAHWDNLQAHRLRVAAAPRPINSVKVYGADTGRYGSDRDGVERFWRNLFGGLAAIRFHRPDSGLGLNDRAVAQIRAARMLAEAFDFVRAEPDAASRLLSDREANEAYLTRIPGEAFAVLFTDGGSVGLDLSGEAGPFVVRWLDIDAGRWQDGGRADGGATAFLEAPGGGIWVAWLERSP